MVVGEIYEENQEIVSNETLEEGGEGQSVEEGHKEQIIIEETEEKENDSENEKETSNAGSGKKSRYKQKKRSAEWKEGKKRKLINKHPLQECNENCKKKFSKFFSNNQRKDIHEKY